jgi:hypothetical protein
MPMPSFPAGNRTIVHGYILALSEYVSNFINFSAKIQNKIQINRFYSSNFPIKIKYRKYKDKIMDSTFLFIVNTVDSLLFDPF